jgi:hypothetical protein
MSFLLFEGMVAVAVLLALAELTSWWAVAALPAAVAAMVKLNDVVAGAVSRDERASRAVAGRRAEDRWDDLLQTEVTPAFGVPGAVGADLGHPEGVRSSRVYVSGSYAPGNGMSGTRSGTGEPVATARAPHENRRFDETTQHNGLQRRGTGGARPAGTSRGRQQGGEAEADRAALVRPEWRQTVTLGRHLRRDDSRAGNGRQAGTHLDANEGRHPGGQPNRHRFA